MQGSNVGSNKLDVEDDGVGNVSATHAFHGDIKGNAKLGHILGDIILSFEEVLILTPRGRYNVVMFPDYLHLCGKMYDCKIMYSCYDPGTGPTKFFYPSATPPSITITLPATQPVQPSTPVIPSSFTTAIPEIPIMWPTSHT